MTQLSAQHCQVCNKDTLPIAHSLLTQYLNDIPLWQLSNVDGSQCLQRIFKFKNFANAMTLSNKIAEIAEQQGHHPALLTEWGKVTVRWWTHSIGGLHMNDFIMAAKTEQLYS